MRRSTARALTVALGAALLLVGCARPEKEAASWSIGVPGTGPSARYGPGDVARAGGTQWIAYAEEVAVGDSRVRIVDAKSAATSPMLASFPGQSPSLERRADGKLVLVTLEGDARTKATIAWREGSKDARTWSAPRAILAGPGWQLESGRLLFAEGAWLLPAVRTLTGGIDEVVCLRSEDDGQTWTAVKVVGATDVAAPVLAVSSAHTLLLVARLGSGLARSLSSDAGRTWSRIEPIGFSADPMAPHTLATIEGGVALAWTEPAPDTTWASPPFRAVRFATSSDAGEHWRALAPLVWRTSRVPSAAALTVTRDGQVTAFLVGRGTSTADLACVTQPIAALDPGARLVREPGSRTALDPEGAAEALALLGTHVLSREAPSQRLFIEGYFQRGLVAAYEALEGKGAWPGIESRPRNAQAARPRWIDPQQGLAHAVTFADWLVSGQDEHGYWPLGYKALYVADMAAAVGLFAALAPHVEPERVRRYEAATARFVAGLERDRMFLDSGACGVGWIETRARDEDTAVREPYLVSTALAGIEVQSWLASRSGDPLLRARALAALDWTLAQLGPDGAFPSMQQGEQVEGAYAAAAYVQEGWMAADLFLQDEAVLERLRAALGAHVGWLVRTQRPDGTWGNRNAEGEWSRTPGIVDFLIWYDRRIESRDDVRSAILVASRSYGDPEKWGELGLARAGKNEEVMRALAGRALAAIVAGRPVF